MRWTDRLRMRLRTLLRPGRVERELDEEMAFHVESQVDAHRRSGLSAGEARRAAYLELGSRLAAREGCRETWGRGKLDAILRDLRLALRNLRRGPASSSPPSSRWRSASAPTPPCSASSTRCCCATRAARPLSAWWRSRELRHGEPTTGDPQRLRTTGRKPKTAGITGDRRHLQRGSPCSPEEGEPVRVAATAHRHRRPRRRPGHPAGAGPATALTAEHAAADWGAPVRAPGRRVLAAAVRRPRADARARRRPRPGRPSCGHRRSAARRPAFRTPAMPGRRLRLPVQMSSRKAGFLALVARLAPALRPDQVRCPAAHGGGAPGPPVPGLRCRTERPRRAPGRRSRPARAHAAPGALRRRRPGAHDRLRQRRHSSRRPRPRAAAGGRHPRRTGRRPGSV